MNDEITFIPFMLFFTVFAVFGWLVETIYRSVKQRHFVNAGLLYGPYVPIYGFGANLILILSNGLDILDTPAGWLLLIITPPILEYFSSILLEKFLHIKLWDYSELPLNIHGRICLQFSFYWIAITLFSLEFFFPLVISLINLIPLTAGAFLSGMLTMMFLIDTYFSWKNILHYKNTMKLIRFYTQENRQFVIDFYHRNHKLPPEIRRFLKPVQTFPALFQELRKNLAAFPEHIQALIRKKLGEFYYHEKK